MAELVQRPVWVDTWIFILIVGGACALAFLATDVGRQALVDERVRVTEALGGAVDDAEYAALQARLPWWVYFVSGGRTLLTPPITILAALGIWAAAGAQRRGAAFSQAMAIAVHATVVLVVGQVLVTPIAFVRESLTSPLNLAAILPGVQDGTVASRLFGTIDLFTLWWVTLIAYGLAALTGTAARRYVGWLAGGYFGFAAIIAGAIALLGGI
jgi:hypothetical protein